MSKPSSIASRIIWSKSYVVSRMWYGVAKSTPQLDKKCTVMTIIYWVMVHAFMHACTKEAWPKLSTTFVVIDMILVKSMFFSASFLRS